MKKIIIFFGYFGIIAFPIILNNYLKTNSITTRWGRFYGTSARDALIGYFCICAWFAIKETIEIFKTYKKNKLTKKWNDNLVHLHQDHLSSSILRTSSTGSVLMSQKYFPFGEPRVTSGSFGSLFNQFTDQYKDQESDIYYYKQRYYDPILSRFITADPLYSEEMDKRGTNSQELNLYAYVKNNPLKYVDDTGLAAVAISGEGLGFLGFRGASLSVGVVGSMDLNPFSSTFLKTEIGVMDTASQKFGIGVAASAGLGVSGYLGNSSLQDLAGPSFGLSGGVGVPTAGGLGGGISYGQGVFGVGIGIKGPAFLGYGSFDINNSSILGKATLIEGFDVWGGVKDALGVSSDPSAQPDTQAVQPQSNFMDNSSGLP